MTTVSKHGLADDYEELAKTLPREMWVFTVDGTDILVRDCEYAVETYTRVGTTTDYEVMAAHDAVLIDGHFWRVIETDTGGYRCQHPYAGRGPILGRELTDVEAILLDEVEARV